MSKKTFLLRKNMIHKDQEIIQAISDDPHKLLDYLVKLYPKVKVTTYHKEQANILKKDSKQPISIWATGKASRFWIEENKIPII